MGEREKFVDREEPKTRLSRVTGYRQTPASRLESCRNSAASWNNTGILNLLAVRKNAEALLHCWKAHSVRKSVKGHLKTPACCSCCLCSGIISRFLVVFMHLVKHANISAAQSQTSYTCLRKRTGRITTRGAVNVYSSPESPKETSWLSQQTHTPAGAAETDTQQPNKSLSQDDITHFHQKDWT